MAKKLVTIWLVFAAYAAGAQVQERQWSLSAFNNATTLPGGGALGIFHTPVHPGLEAGIIFPYHVREKSNLFQDVKLGYFYHRYAQHAIRLYTEAGYQRALYKDFSGSFALGAGYLHSIADAGVYELKDGGYEAAKGIGRPQAMAGAALAFSYPILQQTELRPNLFVAYQFWFQFPFVKSYVPVLPNVALHLGVKFPIAGGQK